MISSRLSRRTNLRCCVFLSVAFCCLGLWQSPAQAVPLYSHSYPLNGSFVDLAGGPALTSMGGVLGANGYSFLEGQGLRLAGALDVEDYSIELYFGINLISSYRKLVDFANRASDNGLYNLNGSLIFYPAASGAGSPILQNLPTHVVLTRDSNTSLIEGYVNGIPQFSFVDSTKIGTFSASQRVAHFFVDDTATSAENPSGFVDFIRIYDRPLTPAEVRQLFVSIPEPTAAIITAPALLAAAIVARTLRRTRKTKPGTAV